MERHRTIFNTLSDVIAKSAFINFRGRILGDEIVWLGPQFFKILLGCTKARRLWCPAGNFQACLMAAVLISQISTCRGTYLNLTSTDKQSSFKRFINQAGTRPAH